ncbi:hypothetical protein K437DRAFT_260034 [Tilletiaria anomala UBC 951]|uniref:Uncharacterized protein n=1 Tax=Tilletiaria anomala (strain ATCC 24038 / CBS 436.72 / UBC 951) TaxID=1037660 RepID=A0A066V5D9_TILAU|nr:uncharacterized protein K437DRAFT_260034 [Tilletiaria anomala UBC 951]KDN36696.1 hypothetical protein K437DRAFT_260034 [Tilletiaria anomala UBC 951]
MEDPFDIWGAPVEASTSSRAAGGPYGAINGTKLAAGKQTRSAENDLFSPDTAGWGIASPNVAPATPSTADPRQTFSRIAAIADDAPLQPPSALAAAAALNSSDLITTPPFSSVPTENLVSSPDRRPSPLEKSDLQLSTMTAPTTPDSELAYYHAQNPVALARANAAIHKQVPDLTLPHPLEPPPAFNLEQSPALHSKDAAKGSETWPSFPKEEKDTDGGFDDFDDFDDAQDGTNGGDASGAVADDFGDFDDFDSGEAAQAQAAESTALRAAPAAAAVAQTEASISSARSASATAILGQRALDVRPGSTSSELIPQLRELFAAPFEPDGERYPLYDAAEAQLSKDGIRQVGGLRQVLVTEELCKLYETLSMMPSLAPVGWTRSRTRREHLVSLGVPINLDEILDGGPAGAGRKALPPLALKIDGATKDASGKGPLSDPGGERPGGSLAPGATAPGKSVGGTPRNGSPGPGKKAERRRIELGLGPMPDVNLKRAEEVVALSEGEAWGDTGAILRPPYTNTFVPTFPCRTSHSTSTAESTQPLTRDQAAHHGHFILADVLPDAPRCACGRFGYVQRHDP